MKTDLNVRDGETSERTSVSCQEMTRAFFALIPMEMSSSSFFFASHLGTVIVFVHHGDVFYVGDDKMLTTSCRGNWESGIGMLTPLQA